MTQSIEQLLTEAVAYDPQSGALTWRERPSHHFTSVGYCGRWNRLFAGKPAFATVKGDGYSHGSIGGKFLTAHRVAWFLHHGAWPASEVDHINRDPRDNRVANLREATSAQNKVNRAKANGASSAHVGVSKVPGGRFVAYLAQRGGRAHLGTFRCETAALLARLRAAKAAYGEFA